jgi:hypothetical protein
MENRRTKVLEYRELAIAIWIIAGDQRVTATD